MTISADVIVTVRNLLYNNWNAADPTQATIGDTRFISGTKPSTTRAPCITVDFDREVPRNLTGGSSPVTIVRCYLWVTAYSLDYDELYKMKAEIVEIIRASIAAPGGGLNHLEVDGVWQRKTGLTSDRAEVVEMLRICAVYFL